VEHIRKSVLALNYPKALFMVLQHHLHRAQDRGGLGFEPTQAFGNLPEGRDPSAPKAKKGNEGSGVHGQQLYIGAD
jgi:hypothetical protein